MDTLADITTLVHVPKQLPCVPSFPLRLHVGLLNQALCIWLQHGFLSLLHCRLVPCTQSLGLMYPAASLSSWSAYQPSSLLHAPAAGLAKTRVSFDKWGAGVAPVIYEHLVPLLVSLYIFLPCVDMWRLTHSL